MNIELLQLKLYNAITALNIANEELRKVVILIEEGNTKVDVRLSQQTIVNWNKVLPFKKDKAK